MDDRQPNPGLPPLRAQPWWTRDHTLSLSLNIPSSRLDQHGAHGVALKVVRPRLRLRALHLDRDAAHAPVQEPPAPPEKGASTQLDQGLDRPRSYMDDSARTRQELATTVGMVNCAEVPW